MRAVLVFVALALAFTSACGGSSKDSSVPVSAACASAMKAESALTDATNPQWDAADVTTITACTSRAEWLSAVKPYTTDKPEADPFAAGQHCIVCAMDTPDSYLETVCDDHSDAPACS